MRHEREIERVCLFADDTRAVTTADDSMLRVWDVAAKTEIWSAKNDDGMWFTALAVSPDGKQLATNHADRAIHLWSTDSGTPIARLEGHVGEGASCLAFAPDGNTLVSGSRDQTVRVWSRDNKEVARAKLPAMTNPFDVAYSPDGQRFALAVFSVATGKSYVIVWDAATCKPIRELEGHKNIIWALAWSPDGNTIATASADKTLRATTDDDKPKSKVCKGHGDLVKSVRFTDDGKHIVSGSFDRTVRVWDAASAKQIASHDLGDKVTRLAVFADGKGALVGLQSGELRIVNL